MKMSIALCTLLLAGCGANAMAPADLKPPPAWAMRPVCALPKPMANDGDPVSRAMYESELRKCAATRGDQARGLQRYARTLTKK